MGARGERVDRSERVSCAGKPKRGREASRWRGAVSLRIVSARGNVSGGGDVSGWRRYERWGDSDRRCPCCFEKQQGHRGYE